MYVGAFDLGKATLTRRWQRLVPPATLKGGGSGWHWRDDAGEVHALVMELVDGPTLADRIARGPIPIAETLAIATQIATALEAALHFTS